MRFFSLILLTMLTTLCVVAGQHSMPMSHASAAPAIAACNVADSSRSQPRVAQPRLPKDTLATATDSVKRDSVKTDTIKAKPGIDSPVEYQASDSMVYDAATGLAFLYGKAQVNYQNMQLTAAKISMNMDSSMVHAEARRD